MGWLLIFKNEHFVDTLPQREGCSQDVQLLKNTFYTFNYHVKIVNDPTVEDIRNNMKSLLEEDLSTALCLVVVVMSHGAQHNIIYDKLGKAYNIVEEIINSDVFRINERLPKIVITQACKEVSKNNKEHIPVETVVLRFDAAFERQKAVRYTNGSPFIAELCKHLSTFGSFYDFKEIANKVLETFGPAHSLTKKQNPTLEVGGDFPRFYPAERVRDYPNPHGTHVPIKKHQKEQ